jgi:hypothetical protein
MRIMTGCYLCLTLMLAAPARATVLVGADLGELSRDAVAIARGTVVAVEARWGDNRRTIDTIVTLEVERYLKGSFGGTLEFRVPGGELGRFRNVVVGAPVFSVDERIIVFLGAHGPSLPYVLGLSQGVFRIALPPGASGWVVASPAFFPVQSAAARIVRGDGARSTVPLADFEQRVRALAGGGR